MVENSVAVLIKDQKVEGGGREANYDSVKISIGTAASSLFIQTLNGNKFSMQLKSFPH
jgi:hypothetical protein